MAAPRQTAPYSKERRLTGITHRLASHMSPTISTPCSVRLTTSTHELPDSSVAGGPAALLRVLLPIPDEGVGLFTAKTTCTSEPALLFFGEGMCGTWDVWEGGGRGGA